MKISQSYCELEYYLFNRILVNFSNEYRIAEIQMKIKMAMAKREKQETVIDVSLPVLNQATRQASEMSFSDELQILVIQAQSEAQEYAKKRIEDIKATLRIAARQGSRWKEVELIPKNIKFAPDMQECIVTLIVTHLQTKEKVKVAFLSSNNSYLPQKYAVSISW